MVVVSSDLTFLKKVKGFSLNLNIFFSFQRGRLECLEWLVRHTNCVRDRMSRCEKKQAYN